MTARMARSGAARAETGSAEGYAVRVGAHRPLLPLLPLLPIVLAGLVGRGLAAGTAPPLVLEQTIPLPDVAGRIDHLSVDVARQRLLVCERGNDTVDVIDLREARVIGRITGLQEPQGVAYVPTSDRIVVANGGDGSVRLFRAGDLAPVGEIALGEDADDLRIDPRSGDVLVGHGSGGLAVIDPAGPSRLADIPLAAHPEAFELDPGSRRVFVNLPDAREIGVVDLASGRQIAAWRVPDARSNFAMAIDPGGSQLAVAFRRPARLVLFDTRTGALTGRLDTCGDADDAFFDARRDRIYVSCGEGAVDVFGRDAAGTRRLQRLDTAPGARTSLFVRELDRLFVAVRARASRSDAAILVLRPAP